MAKFVKCGDDCWINVEQVVVVWAHARSGDLMTLRSLDGKEHYLAGQEADDLLAWLKQQHGVQDGKINNDLAVK